MGVGVATGFKMALPGGWTTSSQTERSGRWLFVQSASDISSGFSLRLNQILYFLLAHSFIIMFLNPFTARSWRGSNPGRALDRPPLYPLSYAPCRSGCRQRDGPRPAPSHTGPGSASTPRRSAGGNNRNVETMDNPENLVKIFRN